ncbi:MAG TPA: alpha/beta hydrolase [Pseudonocardiaceae bacterium]
MNTVLLNVCYAVVGTSLTFAVRALIAFFRTKDYFDKYIRVAEGLGFAERKIEVRDGLVLNVAEGPRNGVPLLLIPGQGCVWQEYCKALPELIGTYHVLVVDVHGHGRSTWNPADYTAVRIADDMCMLVEQVFGEPVVVAGHSSGGLIASLMAARRPDLVRGVFFEDAPFFSTEPDRVPKTYVSIDAYGSVLSFLAQDEEHDWVCWYMPRSYWKRMFGPLWSVFTRSVIRQRREDPTRLPIVRWVGVGINRIWETMSHPYDLRFTVGFTDNSWFRGFDQARTLRSIKCPTRFLKATTRHDRKGNLLAALSDEDLARVEGLLTANRTVRVRGPHDLHFAHTKAYTDALREFAQCIPQGLASPRPTDDRPENRGSRAPAMGYLACGLALLWSLPHFLMAAHVPGFGATAEAISQLDPDLGRDLTEVGVGCFGVCAGLLALALVQNWGRVLPRWLLAVPALAGAVVAGGYGYVSVVLQALIDTAVITTDPRHTAVASGWWYYWYVLFAALGTTFAATAWLTRKKGRRPTAATR